MDEAELIAAARSGNEAAFAELYRLHLGYVKAVGYAILHKDDVEDVCQDTFLLAFTRLRSFSGNSRFRTWITRIAINQCLMILRRDGQISNGDSNLADMDLELLTGLDKDLESVAARLDLDRLLRAVRPYQRRILEMAYLEDMPVQEMAEVLGISLCRVKKSIQRAKEKARKIYEP